MKHTITFYDLVITFPTCFLYINKNAAIHRDTRPNAAECRRPSRHHQYCIVSVIIMCGINNEVTTRPQLSTAAVCTCSFRAHSRQDARYT